MSDFQKLTLKRCARNFLILCGFILLVYGMVKSTFVLYATIAVIVLTIAGACAWAMISSIRWDWQLRGKLTESEYKAYKACDCIFGWRDNKYLPTEEQVYAMAKETSLDKDVLWSMYNKLNEEAQS